MNLLMLWSVLPLSVFLVLLFLERQAPANTAGQNYAPEDWVMNLSGFAMQGVVIPAAGYALSTRLFPHWLPDVEGLLPCGFWCALLLNLILVDFLYYLQHRAFHEIPWLWKFHAPHHYSPTVNIWATSRNAIPTHFLFVYMVLNPILGFLSDSPEGFFIGAMVTAALDVFRHANIRLNGSWLQGVLILPRDHHCHHDASKPFVNYGANWMIWDRIFGTADMGEEYPRVYALPEPPSLATQLFYPWKAEEKRV